MKRRSFLKKASAGGVLLGTGVLPVLALDSADIQQLTILHTNDVHSRIEPFPMDGSSTEGLGGAARRAALIQKIRAEEEQVLLLDAGDIFQGTPYFNYFGGELEFKLMSAMKYDAATIGNHDFDAGIDGLYKQLPNASFPLLISNYDFSDTLMNGMTKPYEVFQKGDLKIGVLGVGIELNGLVPAVLYKATRYLDPLANANHYAAILKHDLKCDYVICLSHLGFEYDSQRVSDRVLAAQSKDIDLIIGGHTHTFMEQPEQVKNAKGSPVLINQVGWAGIMLGRLDILFDRRWKRHRSKARVIVVGAEKKEN